MTHDESRTLLRWRSYPTLFVMEALGAQPTYYQAEALTHLAEKLPSFENYLTARLISGPLSEQERAKLEKEYNGIYGHVTIRSGHGVGKSTTEAWAVWWMMVTHFPLKVPCTANSADQLADVLFAEISKWHKRMPEELSSQFEVLSDRIYLKSSPKESFAVARTARAEKPEALQGFHEENLLFVVDEASAVPDVVFEVAQGALTKPGNKALMCGNPTRVSGFFYDSHTRMRELWHVMRVSCHDSPLVEPNYIESCKIRYGEQSNAYRVRVLGEFPTGDDDAVIPLWIVEDAVNRDIVTSKKDPIVWGLDVARFGDDRTALCKRQKNKVLEPIMFWREKDTMQTASLVTQEYENTPDKDKPDEILVDVIGIGAGVLDRLRENGLPARGCNVSEAPSVSDKFLRLRDELWWLAREWFEARAGSIPPQQDLIDELSRPKYTLVGSGKIRIEGKDEVKKRTVHKNSPDLADAFIMTFASGLIKRKGNKRLKYPSNKEAGII